MLAVAWAAPGGTPVEVTQYVGVGLEDEVTIMAALLIVGGRPLVWYSLTMQIETRKSFIVLGLAARSSRATRLTLIYDAIIFEKVPLWSKIVFL